MARRSRRQVDRRDAKAIVADTKRIRDEAQRVLAAVEKARSDAAKEYAKCLKKAADVGAARRVRFDVSSRPRHHERLLRALAHYDRVQRSVAEIEPRVRKLIDRLDAELDPARLSTTRIRNRFASDEKRQASQTALRSLRRTNKRHPSSDLADEIGEVLREVRRSKRDKRDPWAEYAKRPVVFNELLIDVGAPAPDLAASTGFLPSEIVENIESIRLDTSLLEVRLRRYQVFGAAFALSQQRVILGDEMGLGKTVQAMAMVAHLRAQGSSHFVVVSPASVLANWQHEIIRHTEMDDVVVLHGSKRDERLEQWIAKGGIALTTFGTIGSMNPPAVDLAAMVVDEAHYIKNPDAQRTKAVRAWLAVADRVLLMTGTPMENRVDELETMVSHVNPAVARQMDDVYELGADALRRSLAPVYLRRNQSDVLDELPDRIESAEWVELTGPSARAYGRAVVEGNFMAMRRAAFMTENPSDSPKLQRLLELVDEAFEADRKVVVFSYFIDVIERVGTALGDRLAGTLTGATPAAGRQAVVDAFSEHEGPAVLVAQIEAAGVGLNIQAASMVILTEPQWKPSTEEQAIARCHRMGQLRTVEVYRLLTEDSIDELMVAALADKSALFAEYVRKSALRDASASAADGNRADADSPFDETGLQRQIMEWERGRLNQADTPPTP